MMRKFNVQLILLIIGVMFAFPAPVGALSFEVNDIGDSSGPCDAANCTLREAVEAANANPGPDTITFNIPGSGAHLILLNAPLILTDPGTTIDATTQSGYSGSPQIMVAWSGANPLAVTPLGLGLAPGFWVQAGGIRLFEAFPFSPGLLAASWWRDQASATC